MNVRAFPEIAIVVLATACAKPPPPVTPCPTAGAASLDGTWIDLTHDLASDSIFWPTAERFRHETVTEGVTPGGWYYSSYNISASEHGGTHIDAPVHFAEGKRTVDAIPLDSLIGPAVVIDVSKAALADPDYLFTPDDVTRWEAAHGRIPDRAIVLFHTGYATFWPDAEKYMGTAERGPDAVAKLHFPGLSAEVARFLIEQRRVRAVGLDTPSLDRGQSKDFMAHRLLFDSNIPGFENVTALDQLPPTGSFVIALPTKIRGGSGGPLRIVGFVPRH